MKILQIVGEINGGGVGAVVLSYLSHMNLTNIKCDVIAFRIKDRQHQLLENEFRDIGCNVIYMDHRNTGYVKHFRAFRRILEMGRYDAVHCHFGIWSTPYLLEAANLGIKIRIAHSHVANDEYGRIKQTLLNLTKPLLNCCVTDRMACGYDAGKYLWNNKKFVVLNNAIEIEKFQYNEALRKEYRSKFKIDEHSVVLGNVGRFSYQKNQWFLVHLYENLKKYSDNIKLILIGEGEEYKEIECYVKKKKLEESILLLGLRKDVAALFQMIDVFLLPSRYEGLPVVAIEAQCAGVPCVLSDKITKEVVIRKNLMMLPIEPENECIETWGKKIVELVVNNSVYDDRKRSGDEVRIAGYDIHAEAEKLRQFYVAREKQK